MSSSRSPAPSAAAPPPIGKRIKSGRFTSVVNFLTETEKLNLLTYDKDEGRESITQKLLTPFWDYVAKLVPRSVAPNVLSLAGLLCQVQAFYIAYMHGSSEDKMLRRVVPLFACALTVISQTLGAIDAKHAQNTRNASPVTELFQYTSQLLGASFVVLTLACCLGMNLRTSDDIDHIRKDCLIVWCGACPFPFLFFRRRRRRCTRVRAAHGPLTAPASAFC